MIIIKTPKQIDGIRKASKLASQTLKYLVPFIQAGITTNALNDLAEGFIKANNGIPACLGYMNYPKSICTSVNDVICHGIPNEYILKEGDIIKIDVVTIVDGYFGDTCATFPIGKISKEKQHLIDITKKSMMLGIQQVKHGKHIGNIGEAITNYAHKNGYSVMENFTGHGVGIALHEKEPVICHNSFKNTGPIMQTGMIFTIEPMLNEKEPNGFIDPIDGWTVRTVDGGLSAQFEHSILVTPKGYEILTLL